ncbi:hypothetical protein TVAG_456540 [Trichomonas vaginalis G3]|uniref:LisH domain-containing protein n=1 Tax=Trichomonas vaginalis (strain ATCC PRA-98 / G3) TaxID=412133 RepID=A2DBX8_TRIV3|nr:hypothetical protein TVAGG3_0264290 [Trichomonas vaginalis G3]EAY22019.1 hypothetical protein TVAG_456540 [Trichomonas vaginalis G3]KAI5525356.1 hypothetical protein TVAGG3_0264290 [Trichomonas vaginalis G3]|eukprot:XP_001583005.1 hypothetical protein [Trichomonas vaginalis G3]
MSDEQLNNRVLETMKKNGTFMKLYSFFLAKIDEEAQKQDIDVMKPYRQFKKTKPNQIAADFVIEFLTNKKYNNTLDAIAIESKKSEIFEVSNYTPHDKELQIPKSSHPIQALEKEWMKNVTDPFYENRDRLSAQIQKLYSHLDEGTEATKSPLPKYSIPPPLKPVYGESPKEEKSKNTKAKKESPKQSAKLPPPLVPSKPKKKTSKAKPKPPSDDETYSVTGTTTESIEPWNPLMGVPKRAPPKGNLNLPKPKGGVFQYQGSKNSVNSSYETSD